MREGKQKKALVLYSVWDNRTDELLILDGSAEECAKAMHVSIESFYPLVSRSRKGERGRWTIRTLTKKARHVRTERI